MPRPPTYSLRILTGIGLMSILPVVRLMIAILLSRAILFLTPLLFPQGLLGQLAIDLPDRASNSWKFRVYPPYAPFVAALGALECLGSGWWDEPFVAIHAPESADGPAFGSPFHCGLLLFAQGNLTFAIILVEYDLFTRIIEPALRDCQQNNALTAECHTLHRRTATPQSKIYDLRSLAVVAGTVFSYQRSAISN